MSRACRFTPKSGHAERGGDVRFVPKADSCTAAKEARLFDDLVGTRKQRLRHGKPECPRGFEIDRKHVFGRRLDR
jgi:hypothetical protein